MNAERFDLLARHVEKTGTRRALVRGAVGLVAGLAGGGLHRPAARAADPVPPPPPGSVTVPWPVCSEARPHYCVSTFTVDGVDQLGPNPSYSANVYGYVHSDLQSDAQATSLMWAVQTETGARLRAEDLGKEVLLRVRTDRLKLHQQQQWSGPARIRFTGSEESGVEMETRGRTGLLAFPDEPPADQEQAVYTEVVFAGSGYAREEWPPDNDVWEGYYALSVWAWTFPEWIDGGWQVRLGNPHFLPDGSVYRGSYCAWLAPDNLRRMGLTAEEAAAGELTVTRIDEGVVSPVDATISAEDGGAYVAIVDLTFSNPTLVMRPRRTDEPEKPAGPGCPRRCGKGRRCKGGRCVKTKGKRRKKH